MAHKPPPDIRPHSSCIPTVPEPALIVQSSLSDTALPHDTLLPYFSGEDSSDSHEDGFLFRCGGDLPCASIDPSLPLTPVLDDSLPPMNFSPDSTHDVPTSVKRSRPQAQPFLPLLGCACACSALQAATAKASAFAAAAAAAAVEAVEAANVAVKLRKCCGGNCRCPPAGCHCPQSAIPTATYPCQSEPVDCSHMSTIAKTLTAALAAATSQAPCTASVAPSDVTVDRPPPPRCCRATTHAPTPGPAPKLRDSAPSKRVAPCSTVVASSVPSPPVVANSSSKATPSGQEPMPPTAAPETTSQRVSHRSRQPDRDRPFPCDKCPSTFLFKQNRDRHVTEVHYGHRPHKCPYPKCEAAFKNLSGLKQHQKTVHEKARPFKCDKCESAFGQRNHLRQHVLVVHDKLKMFPCNICGMSFSNVGNRTQHMKRRHNGAVPGPNLSRSQQHHQQQQHIQQLHQQPLQSVHNQSQSHDGNLGIAENTNGTSSSSPGMESETIGECTAEHKPTHPKQ